MEEKIKCAEVQFYEYSYGKTYLYKCPFENVEVGDIVEVPVTINSYNGDKEEKTEELKRAYVVSVKNYTEKDTPFPFQWMKTIKNVIENKLRRLRKTNPPEVLKKIEAIQDLDNEIDEYCIKKYGHSLIKNYVMGNCFAIWAAKKKILKEKYNIDWLTPAECYPDIIFD